jgi:glutamine synthetase
MKLMAGVEPEFHLINADGSASRTIAIHAEKPCYDQAAIMRRLDVIAEICDDDDWSSAGALPERP